jgi:hypothetical protein
MTSWKSTTEFSLTALSKIFSDMKSISCTKTLLNKKVSFNIFRKVHKRIKDVLSKVISKVLDIENMTGSFALILPLFTVCVKDTVTK